MRVQEEFLIRSFFFYEKTSLFVNCHKLAVYYPGKIREVKVKVENSFKNQIALTGEILYLNKDFIQPQMTLSTFVSMVT